VQPISLTGAATQVLKAIQDMSFMSSAMKDVSNGKNPPARSATWQTVIADANNLASTIKVVTVISGGKRGDVSPEAQNDCARYTAVLDAFRQWYEDLAETQKELPKAMAAVPEFKDISKKLGDASDAADSLMKTYAALSKSPVPAVRECFAWGTYDLIMVAKAFNEAKSEADIKVKALESFSAGLPARVNGAKVDFENYEKRMPAMRDYCAKRR
jgi:hypothetical protein